MTPNYTAFNCNSETLSIPASMTKPDLVQFELSDGFRIALMEAAILELKCINESAEERIAAALLQIEQGLSTYDRHEKQACLKSVRDILKGAK